MPPGGFGSGAYQLNSSKLRIDGGEWLDIPNPLWDHAKGILKWPTSYNCETETGGFSPDPENPNYFFGIQNFTPRQVKEIQFKMTGTLDNDKVHCNWVVLKPWDTNSGPQAPITVGYPDNPGECGGLGVFEVSKTSYPEIIQPLVEQTITYTISITNVDGSTHNIQEINDYLPPGFYYEDDSTTGITTSNPQGDGVMETINGIERQRLTWQKTEFPGENDVQIQAGETLTLTLQARTTKDVSGSYYNEVIVIPAETGTPGGAFGAACVSPADYSEGYSWNSGVVTVPTYDSRADAEGIILDANLALVVGGVSITSYQMR